MLSKCPIMSKVCKIDLLYEQNKHEIDNKTVIVTTHFNNNKRIIVYLPGFDDYFYYANIVDQYKYIDFISIDLPGFGYNKGYTYDNHISNINDMCFTISNVMTLYTEFFVGKDVDILGFSMGGHIAMCYVWLSETFKFMFPFRRLLLSNPLLHFRIDYHFLSTIAVMISRVTYAFSSTWNIKPTYLESVYEDNMELENIYSKQSLKHYNIDNFNTCELAGVKPKEFYNGTMVSVLNSVQNLCMSDGIKTRCICVCSKSFGNEPLKQDSICDPDDTCYYLPKICTDFSIKKFEMGHNAFKQPFYANTNYIEICNYLFQD